MPEEIRTVYSGGEEVAAEEATQGTRAARIRRQANVTDVMRIEKEGRGVTYGKVDGKWHFLQEEGAGAFPVRDASMAILLDECKRLREMFDGKAAP